MMRNRNDGLRKVCGCPRRGWTKCKHPWHFNFAHNGEHYRYSVDRIVGRPIRTKGEAEAEAERIRIAIRDGTFRRPGEPDPRPVLAGLTLQQLLALYDERYLSVERLAAAGPTPARRRVPESLQNERYQMAAIARIPLSLPAGGQRQFGDWFVADITTDTIEQFRAARRQSGVVVANRNLALLRAAFNWAIRVGYLERTPFKRGTETVVKLSQELKRRRRLEGDEADRLLAACGEHLRAVVEAALETGCRLGELLSLQWHQVRAAKRAEIVLPARKTKTKQDRRIPISTRLQAILAMRRSGPDGLAHPPDAYVFGNEIGQRVKRVSRAWERAVLVAHGHTPEYDAATKGLTPTSRAQLRAIDLHFHDLRREAGSRWLDGGVPLHVIKTWLGHANISQTSTYLEATFVGQHEAMARYEARRAESDAEVAAPLQPFASPVGKEAQSGVSGVTNTERNTAKNTGMHH